MSTRTTERSLARLGLLSSLVVALVLAAALGFGHIRDLVGADTYRAAFADTGGLHQGDPVRISGVEMGSVKSVSLEGDHIEITFTSRRDLGSRSRLAIRTETLLGARFLDVELRGTTAQRTSEMIGKDRTTTPYDLATALSDLGSTAGQLDAGALTRSLDMLSDVFAHTPASVRAVLQGTKTLATTISARDAELGRLLRSAERISGVLAQRSTDIVQIMADSNALLAALSERRDAIRMLVSGLEAISDQLQGFVRDHRKTLVPALDKLHQSMEVINANAANISHAIEGVSGFLTALMEGVGSGAFFNGFLAGITPVSMEPALDALGPLYSAGGQ